MPDRTEWILIFYQQVSLTEKSPKMKRKYTFPHQIFPYRKCKFNEKIIFYEYKMKVILFI